jgi:flagellar hook-length control protein FliK
MVQTARATAGNEPLPITITFSDLAESKVDEQMVVLPAEYETLADKVNQNLSSTRHSIRQQYYDGKIFPENTQESQTSSEESPQENTFSSKTTQTAKENTTTTLTLDQTSTFTQPLTSGQEGQKSPTVESLPPVTLPSGTVVQQEDVIRQIMERFQITRRDNDTRINIQLHPAELGELKISLSVKEGSVRANVVASSQFAQEIIEKNMTKLRTVLENQGFTVGEMSITCKSDTSGDFNLFDRQLFSQNDYTPPSAKNTRPPGTLFIMEDTSAREQISETGVNVKI